MTRHQSSPHLPVVGVLRDRARCTTEIFPGRGPLCDELHKGTESLEIRVGSDAGNY